MSGKPLVCVLVLLILLLSISLFQTRSVAQGQTAVSLPTLIDTSKTPPDLTIPTSQGDVLVGAGDFNGDGATDLLFDNIPGPSDFVQGVNGSTIVFGRPGLTASAIRPESSSGSLSLNLRSLMASPYQGPLQVEALPDLAGKNISDIAVTAFSDMPLHGEKVDALYVVFGSDQLQPGTGSALRADVTVFFPDSVKGLTLVGAADVNGDGNRDLVFLTFDEHSTARVNILLGPFNSGRVVDLRLTDPDVVMVGVLQAIVNATLADINGDGVSDILIGSDFDIGRDSFGQVNIILGSPRLKGGLLIQLYNEADAFITNTSAFTNLAPGIRIAVGDFNGDGIDDVLVGGFENGAEVACVVFGSPSIKGRIVDLSKGQQDVTVSGLKAGFGTRLLADFDGDGIADILLAARARPLAGGHDLVSAVYGILGSRALAHGARIDVSRFEQDLTIIAEDPDHPFDLGQFKVDVNGDGVADIVVGNDFDIIRGALFPNALPPGIIFGGPIRPPSIAAASLSHRSLTITGSNLTGACQIEVNGDLLGSTPVFLPAAGALTAKGKPSALNLHSGANQIVVIRKGIRSNAFQLGL
jgi:hypothetical protein